MKIIDVISRRSPEPWAEGEKIPWDDPDFSARMLKEHLTQEHDRASRRREKISQHIQWIHSELLDGKTGRRILDLGCGPGFYCAALARLGHTCVGVDFSPASIKHARSEAARAGLDIEYRLQDLRAGKYGQSFDLALLISGEFNVFRSSEIAEILAQASSALTPDGMLVLEVHTFEYVRELGQRSATWFSAHQGLFSDKPHLCLTERSWISDQRATVERYYIIDANTSEVTRHASTMLAYTIDEYLSLLRDAGFASFSRHASLAGEDGDSEEGLQVIVADKAD